MNRKCFVLFIVLVNCLICNCSYSGEECEESKNAGTIRVPVLILYIYGFVIILLVFLLIFLVFVLVKTQFLNILKKGKYSTKLVEKETKTSPLFEVKSMKRLNLDRSNSFEFKAKNTDNLSSRANNSNDTMKLIKTEAPHRTPTRTESSGNLSPRIIKGTVKEMPIILPEQMSEICKAVLTRANKNGDSGGSLHNIDQLVKETLDDEIKKKFASSPVLDLYDNLPSTKNINKVCKDNSGDSTMTIENNHIDTKTPTKLISFEDKKQLQSNEIYDLPKEPSNAMQTNYVEPYFLFTKSGEDNPSLKGENNLKTAYAVLSEVKNKNNSSDYKGEVPTDHYEFPSTPDIEQKMYINANENMFKC